MLGCGPAYAQAVAEHALGLALDLARGISREDRAFRAGRERYLGEGNADAVLLRHADVGLVGYGNLGRALRPLLAPFAPTVRVYDPWLPDAVLRDADVAPASLDEVLSRSTFVFVLATVTGESEHLLGPRELDLLPEGARLVLVSRAAVTDYEALAERVTAGRFLAAVDVWPEEPVPAGSPFRSLEGVMLSAHRAGGIPAAFLRSATWCSTTSRSWRAAWLRSACSRPPPSWSVATGTVRRASAGHQKSPHLPARGFRKGRTLVTSAEEMLGGSSPPPTNRTLRGPK